MKRATILGLLSALITCTASAQSDTQGNYATNWDGKQSTNTVRYLKSVTFTPTVGTTKTVNIHTAPQSELVVDKTSEVVYVQAGASLDISVTEHDTSKDHAESNSEGCWMNAYAYVDENKNGQFEVTVNENTMTLSGEIKAWSFYSFNTGNDTSGKNDANATLNTDALRQTRALSPFTVPTTPGTYRLRVKLDWNNVNPKGSTVGQSVAEGGGKGINTEKGENGLQSFGGTIVDFTLVVVQGANLGDQTISGNNKRHISSFSTNGVRTAQQASLSGLSTNDNRKVYQCCLGQELSVKCGDKITAQAGLQGDIWINAYLYVDENQDGKFSFDVDDTQHKAKKGSELKSFSFYSFSTTDENNGYDSEGKLMTNNNRATQALPAFYAPQKPGKYLARIKFDWNNINPMGDSTNGQGSSTNGEGEGDGKGGGSIQTNCGEVIDFILNVTEDPASEENKNALTADVNKANAVKAKIGTGLGQYSSQTYASAGAFEPVVNEANQVVTETPNWTAVDLQRQALTAALNTFTINQPATERFYRFKAANGGYMTTAAGDNVMTLTTEGADNNAATVFYLDKDKHLVAFKNGLAIKEEAKMRPVSETTEKAATFGGATTGGADAVGKYTVKVAEKYLAKGETTMTAADTETAEAGWTMEAAAVLPVTITEARYATLYSPVAVQIPTGVKAYYGKYDGKGNIDLTEINGVIPAGTAVVLEETGDHQSAPYLFTITEESATAVGENSLYGQVDTELKTGTHYGGKKVFTLGKEGDRVGFFKYLDTKENGVRGFGASIVVDQQSEALSIAFNFNPTGIESLPADTEEAAPQAVYDLSGRRVTRPTKGLYIINGEKKIIR